MSAETQSNQTLILSLLEQNTPVSFRAGGPSMTPTLRDGDCVRVRPLALGDLRLGAILLYRKNDRLVLHRLVRKNETLFFCGDAALNGVERIDADNVLGTATRVQRAGQTVALDTPRHRLTGRVRYSMRPMRRLIVNWIRPHRATSSS